MSERQLKYFVQSLCNLQIDNSESLRMIALTTRTGSQIRPTGDWPSHWIDDKHEEDGGMDVRGFRPQMGVTVFTAEVGGLSYRCGYEAAWDDVTNAELLRAGQGGKRR